VSVPSAAGLWRHRDFTKLWAGQTISHVGSQISLLALPLTAALTLRATPVEMGILSAVETAPFLLVGLFAGVWVDRQRRRPILLITDGARGMLLFAVPVAALLDALTIGLLCVVALLVGVLTVFFDVAYQSFLPTLVGREQLVEGNSKLEVSRSAAQIAGPGVAGGLVQLVTAPVAIAVDAASFLLSALFLAFVRAPEAPPAPRMEQRSIGKEIGAGLHVVMRNPLLRAIAGAAAMWNLGGNAAQAVMILYITRRLGLGAGIIGLIFAVGSVGFLCGALIAGRVARRIGLGPAIIGSMAACSFAALLIPIAQRPATFAIPLVIASQFISGCCWPIFNINQVSLRQAITPDHLLGRMNATMRVLTWGTMPIGSVIGLRPTLIVGGIVHTSAVLWTLCSPVRTLRSQPAGTAASSEPDAG
jgi:MFS family permease